MFDYFYLFMLGVVLVICLSEFCYQVTRFNINYDAIAAFGFVSSVTVISIIKELAELL
jgi:hypothetical protein